MSFKSRKQGTSLCLWALIVLHYCCQQSAQAFTEIHSTFATTTSLRNNEASKLCVRCTSNHHLSQQQHYPTRTLALRATGNDSSEKSTTSKSARERGIYARPSAAIEKGSGFFIPGLEGSRIRFLFGITVLVADAANHALVGGKPGDIGQLVAESSTAFYGAFLLLQGSIELAAEKGYALRGGTDVSSSDRGGGNDAGEEALGVYSSGLTESISEVLAADKAAAELVQRMAETIINFTPAIYFRFVDENLGDLYSFGLSKGSKIMDDNETMESIKASLDALSESRGGRVALPNDHPASKLVPESARRCILIQKTAGLKGGNACFVIGSDRLLPSFTKNDLRWIGQLADYSNLTRNQR